MEILEEDMEILNIVQNGFPRRIYDRNNHFDTMDNLTFFRRFRFTKPTVLRILEQIEDQLEFPDDRLVGYLHFFDPRTPLEFITSMNYFRNNAISPVNQLLTCLRCYATGGHLSSCADFMGISVSSASRIVKKVSEAIAGLRPQYIEMPMLEDAVATSNKLFQIASFPRVLGCIDGTHIRIQSPGGEDAELFRNRKGYFSVNTQVVGDADLRIRDVVANWPGSTHDQTILINSRIRARFEENEFPNSILLGDSGYALKNYLLTPIADPRTRPQQLYNEAHIRTRNTIDRLIGVWKRRFPILAYGCRLQLDTTLAMIPATAVLHNIAIQMNEGEPPADDNMGNLNYLIEGGNIPDFQYDGAQAPQGQVLRNNIVNYFANL